MCAGNLVLEGDFENSWPEAPRKLFHLFINANITRKIRLKPSTIKWFFSIINFFFSHFNCIHNSTILRALSIFVLEKMTCDKVSEAPIPKCFTYLDAYICLCINTPKTLAPEAVGVTVVNSKRILFLHEYYNN